MRLLLFAIGVVMATAGPAQAQTLSVGFWGYAPFGIDDLDGSLGPGAEIRLSLPVSEGFALEPFVLPGSAREAKPHGLFGAAVQQRLARGATPHGHAFLSYGLLTNGGGFVPEIGAGLERRLSPRIALRGALHFVTLIVPIGMRASIGISVGR